MSEPTQFPDPVAAQILPRACGSTGAILAAIRRSDLDQPTPCASWKVRDVVNHILGGAAYFAELAEAGAVADRGEEEPDLTGGDFSGTFRREASRLAAAYSAPGVLDQELQMPIGAMPGSVCAWIAASDIFAHGWDLAKATGQSTDLDPELATQLLAFAQGFLSDALRGPDGTAPFGAAVATPPGASPADELAAFLGRQP
jgi:uncharacterized protein (TIGR03086 family)